MTAVNLMRIFGRLFCILAGGLTVSFLGTKIVLAPVGQWYEMNRAQDFNDVSYAYALALLAQAIFFIIGGWLGNRLFCRWRQKRLGRR